MNAMEVHWKKILGDFSGSSVCKENTWTSDGGQRASVWAELKGQMCPYD